VYDGTPHPWEFARVWHLEPSLDDPDTVLAGVEDAALFRSRDAGATWTELSGLRGHDTGPHWQPGAGGMCLHTIILSPADPGRIVVAISAAGAFRTDDGGGTWRPINRVCTQKAFPTPTPRSGTACTRSRCTIRAPTYSSCRSTGTSCAAMTLARTGARSAATCERLRLRRRRARPRTDTVYVLPITSDSMHFRPRVSCGSIAPAQVATIGAPDEGTSQSNCYVDVLRDAMSVDSSTVWYLLRHHGRQVYVSSDEGDSWDAIVRDLPAVLSVEVQTLV